MARITVEDCLTKENNRFALVQLAAKRTKQILSGSKVLLKETRNKAVVTALREIADGQVRFMSSEESRVAAEQEAAQPVLPPEARIFSRPIFNETNGGTNGHSEKAAVAGDEDDSDDDGEE